MNTANDMDARQKVADGLAKLASDLSTFYYDLIQAHNAVSPYWSNSQASDAWKQLVENSMYAWCDSGTKALNSMAQSVMDHGFDLQQVEADAAKASTTDSSTTPVATE